MAGRRDIITPNKDFSEFITDIVEESGGNMANALFVDGTNGNNNTASRSNSAFPYATIAAAVAAAVSGDTVFVAPGTYNERVALKNGVNIEGLQADLIYTGAASGAVLSDGADGGNQAVTCTIRLRKLHNYAVHNLNTYSNTCITISNSSSNVYLECREIKNNVTGGASVNRAGVYCTNGTLLVRCAGDINSVVYDGVLAEVGSPNLTVYADRILGGNGSTTPRASQDSIEVTAGTAYVECREALAAGSVINAGGGTLKARIGYGKAATVGIINSVGTVEAWIDELLTVGTSAGEDFAVTNELTGVLKLYNCRLVGNDVADVVNHSGATTYLIRCRLKAGAAALNAITIDDSNLTLQECLLQSGSSGKSIAAGSANKVNLWGASFGKYALHANVTAAASQPGSFTVASGMVLD